jgi:hypothetical protein
LNGGSSGEGCRVAVTKHVHADGNKEMSHDDKVGEDISAQEAEIIKQQIVRQVSQKCAC